MNELVQQGVTSSWRFFTVAHKRFLHVERDFHILDCDLFMLNSKHLEMEAGELKQIQFAFALILQLQLTLFIKKLRDIFSVILFVS